MDEKELKKELARLKRLAVEIAGEIHDIVEDTLWGKYNELPILSAKIVEAIKEAEAYNGPSIIIAYAPCINHGIKGGMGNAQHEMKRAVDCGYWHLYRYNPLLKEEGKNPFILDSKEPQQSFREYLMGETRYAALTRTFPDIAEELFAKAEEFAKKKYETYKELADK